MELVNGLDDRRINDRSQQEQHETSDQPKRPLNPNKILATGISQKIRNQGSIRPSDRNSMDVKKSVIWANRSHGRLSEIEQGLWAITTGPGTEYDSQEVDWGAGSVTSCVLVVINSISAWSLL
jgi:hypothetical protein